VNDPRMVLRPTRRPVFLNLARIRYPVGAVASIGHRISGVLLVLALPFAVLALQYSLQSEVVETPAAWVRLPAALLAWACAHHLFAGIRHLLTDVGIGSSLPAARASAYAALIVGGAVGLAFLVL
jgi:succinate dehydrogenase / fumarate reductase, cytochrome b subunit